MLVACLAAMVGIMCRFAEPGPAIDTTLDALGPLVIILALAFVAFIFSGEWADGTIVKSLQVISKYSYGIYLSHAVVLAAVLDLCFKLDRHSYGLGYGIYAFAIVLPASLFIGVLGASARSRMSTIIGAAGNS